MRERFRPIATNLTPVNVVGIPGLALVAIAVALGWQFPEVQWLIAAGLTGGTAIAVLLIRRRAHRSSDDDDRWSHGTLGVSHDDTHRRGPFEPDPAGRDRDPRRGALRPRLDPLRPLTWTPERA
jgi:hypothetical protein